MIAYQTSCDDCTVSRRFKTPRAALRAMRRHRCPNRRRDAQGLLTCRGCGGGYPMLVDDGDLCIRCDAFHFPPEMAVSA